MPDLTAPQIAWASAGSPAPTKLVSRKEGRAPVALVAHDGQCATCGGTMESGMPVADVLNETFSQHGDYLKWGTHVCPACAWFFTDPKQHHRAFLGAGDLFLWPVLGEASVTEDRPLWRNALRRLVDLPEDTPAVALLTTDPKPRLWPRVQAGTAARLRAYVHSPDDDLSATVELETVDLLSAIDLIEGALAAGFNRATVRRGLLSDIKTAGKDLAGAVRLEGKIAAIRRRSVFIPAVLLSLIHI